MHFFSNEEKAKWIQYYIERETTGAKKRLGDAESVIHQEQDDSRKAENTGLTNSEPEMTVQEMMVSLGDGLSDLASSDDGVDGEDEDDEETVQGQLGEDDELGWVMSTITKPVQQRMERFRQKQMKLDQLTQPGWENEAKYFRERDKE